MTTKYGCGGFSGLPVTADIGEQPGRPHGKFCLRKSCGPGPYDVIMGLRYLPFHCASNSCSRIHFKMRRSRREICTCVVPRTRAVSLWVRPAKKRSRIS